MKLMAICAAENRNALGDGFVGIMNHFSHPEVVIAVIPASYDVNEFNPKLHSVIKEDYRNIGKIKSKLQCIRFYKKLARLAKKEKVNRIFIYSDSEWANIVHLLFPYLRHQKTTVYIHDPRYHTGEEWIVKCTRKLIYPFYWHKASIIVSYRKAIDELKKCYPHFQGTSVTAIKLPSMPVMEFADIHKKLQKDLWVQTYDLIYFGRLEAYKGLDILLEANRFLIEKYNITYNILLVGGRGHMKSIIQEEVKAFQNVTFIDEYVSNRQLAEYIASSKVVILPYKEATGTQTVQIANYYYKPIIAHAVGCFDEYIKEGQNGYLTHAITVDALADVMRTTLATVNDPSYNKQMVFNTYCAKFNINKLAREIELVCKK